MAVVDDRAAGALMARTHDRPASQPPSDADPAPATAPAPSKVPAKLPATGVRRLAGALGVALLVLLVVAVWFAVKVVGGFSADHGRSEALAAGQRAAVEFTSFDYSTAMADLKRLQGDTTAGFVQGFTDDRDAFVKSLQSGKVKVVGQATAAGLYGYTGDQAHVLVAIKAQFQSAQSPTPQERDYRMDLSMVYRDGRWLADAAGFVA